MQAMRWAAANAGYALAEAQCGPTCLSFDAVGATCVAGRFVQSRGPVVLRRRAIVRAGCPLVGSPAATPRVFQTRLGLARTPPAVEVRRRGQDPARQTLATDIYLRNRADQR